MCRIFALLTLSLSLVACQKTAGPPADPRMLEWPAVEAGARGSREQQAHAALSVPRERLRPEPPLILAGRGGVCLRPRLPHARFACRGRGELPE